MIYHRETAERRSLSQHQVRPRGFVTDLNKDSGNVGNMDVHRHPDLAYRDWTVDREDRQKERLAKPRRWCIYTFTFELDCWALIPSYVISSRCFPDAVLNTAFCGMLLTLPWHPASGKRDGRHNLELHSRRSTAFSFRISSPQYLLESKDLHLVHKEGFLRQVLVGWSAVPGWSKKVLAFHTPNYIITASEVQHH